jgi:hypothetical protein
MRCTQTECIMDGSVTTLYSRKLVKIIQKLLSLLSKMVSLDLLGWKI